MANNPISNQVTLKETWPSTYWIVPLAPLFIYMSISLMLNITGKSNKKGPVRYFFDSISNNLEQLTGVAGWAMAGILTGLLFLLEAAIGLYWDVAWHVDLGRDRGTLFTPPHVTILLGLGGLIFASIISISFASAQEAETKLRFGSRGQVRVPFGGLLIGILGVGAIVAFPLDALWHATYGIDVTLWSPTHLQLITGGSLGAFAVMLMFAEAMPHSKPNPHGRFWLIVAAGAVLTACSTYQGEFDFRVPQFNPVYLPILMMAAAGVALVWARIAIGKWGAVKAVAAFLVIRTFLSVLVVGLHHTFAHFPLYLPEALAVEGAALLVGTRSRLKFGLLAGIGIGTLGLLGETIWIGASNWFQPAPQLLVKTLELAPITAVAAALLGAGLGRMFQKGESPMPVPVLGLSGLVLIAALMIPLPRQVIPVNADIKTTPIGDGTNGTVSVAITPADAANNALFFGIASWQGGGTKRITLKQTSPGVYTESAPVPITGRWKSLVVLVKGNINMAAPVYMPIDPYIHAAEIPAVPDRVIAFSQNTHYLLRESHGGPPGPKELGYAGLVLSLLVFVALIAYGSSQTDTVESDEGEFTPRSGGTPAWMNGYKAPVTNGSYSWQPSAPAPPARWNPAGLSGVRR